MEPILNVVSMLISNDKVTLITAEGQLEHISVSSQYDVGAIIEYLTASLTGVNSVELVLSDFSTIKRAIRPDSEGIVTIMQIDGKEVEGVFYPATQGAVVKLEDQDVVIPDVSPLADQISRASDEDSDSVRNFLLRLAPVIAERKHSGEDLMEFIRTSELPLTHDGKLIAYKRVNKAADGYFTDCHTGNILQRVGSRVTMPVDMVDPSRHKSCSTGLHVANLDYIRNFHGSDTIIVLVDPANFIAVPHGENTKARVCSYDIIGSMSTNAHGSVIRGVHAEDTDLQTLIENAVQGNSVEPFEEVIVGDRTITEVRTLTGTNQPSSTKKKKKVKKKAKKKATSGKSLRTDKQVKVQKVQQVRSKVLESKGHSTLDDTIVVAFQTLADTPYLSVGDVAASIGISGRTLTRWMDEHNYTAWQDAYLNGDVPVTDAEGDNPTVASEEVEPIVATETSSEEEDTPEPTKEVPPSDGQAVKRTKLGQATYDLYEAWRVTESQADLDALLLHKRNKKKGWAALGLTAEEIDTVLACI